MTTNEVSQQTINFWQTKCRNGLNPLWSKAVDLFTHDYCVNLARQLHIKTGLPIYAIYDHTERVYSWGVNYWHFFVKVSDDCYLNAHGLHTEKEMIAFWADAWDSELLLENSRIIKKEPELSSIDDDPYMEMFGAGRTIHPHTVEFADIIIKIYL